MSLFGYSFDMNINDLRKSIRIGNLNDVRNFFAKYSKDKVDKEWKSKKKDLVSPIHEATQYGQNDILKFLLSDSIGFNVNELTSVCAQSISSAFSF